MRLQSYVVLFRWLGSSQYASRLTMFMRICLIQFNSQSDFGYGFSAGDLPSQPVLLARHSWCFRSHRTNALHEAIIENRTNVAAGGLLTAKVTIGLAALRVESQWPSCRRSKEWNIWVWYTWNDVETSLQTRTCRSPHASALSSPVPRMCVMTRRIYPVLNTDSTTAGTDSVRPSVHHMASAAHRYNRLFRELSLLSWVLIHTCAAA